MVRAYQQPDLTALSDRAYSTINQVANPPVSCRWTQRGVK